MLLPGAGVAGVTGSLSDRAVLIWKLYYCILRGGNL